MGKVLLSPWMLACYTMIATLPYWASPIAYLTLRTFEFAPSGLVPWILIVLLGSYAVWAFVAYIFYAVKEGRRMHQAKLAADGGDESAAEVYAELRGASMPVWRFASAFMAMQALIPITAALVIGNQLMAETKLVRSGKELRYESPQESLNRVLRRFEQKGIFRALRD